MTAPVLSLPERLTHVEAPACLHAFQRAAGRDGDLRVDASALREFDSAALSLLLSLRRWATASGRAVRIEQVPPRLHELVALYGLQDVLAS